MALKSFTNGRSASVFPTGYDICVMVSDNTLHPYPVRSVRRQPCRPPGARRAIHLDSSRRFDDAGRRVLPAWSCGLWSA